MSEYIDRKEEIEIPRGSGIDGFLRTVQKILELPRVQYIHIEKGKVGYARSVRPNEPKEPLGVDFETLMPSHVIKSATIVEEAEELNAGTGICRLLRRAALQHLCPIAFVSGPKTHFWEWHRRTVGVDLQDTPAQLYGLQFLFDEGLPNEALFLCTGYSKGAALVDTRFVFKMVMPLGLEARS